MQEVGLVLKQLRRQLLHHPFQPLGRHRRNSVPRLGLAPAEDTQLVSVVGTLCWVQFS